MKLNTQNCCFLCLRNFFEGYSENSHLIQRILLRCLIRHLQVNLNGVGADSSNIQTDSDVEVDLCGDCAQLNNKFSKLFLHLEKIQMEMDFYLGRIHHRILESSRNAELFQNYSMEMTSDRESLTQLAFVDKLRKEIGDKSSRLVNPRVCLMRTELAKVITVKHEEIEDDYFEDHNSDGFEDSPEQLDIGLSSQLKSEVTVKVKRVRDNVGKCFSRNLSTGLYHCIICRKEFKRSDKVRVHYDYVHLKKTFNCDKCSTPFTTNHHLKRHKKTCNGTAFKIKVKNQMINVYYTKNNVTALFQCTKCGKQYRIRKSVVAHYKSVHLKKRYKCDICNVKEFARSKNLNYHKKRCKGRALEELKKNNKSEKTVFVCKFCENGYPSRRALGVHRRMLHLNTGSFACSLCEKKFKWRQSLKEHRDRVHFGKRFECRFCRRNYWNKYKKKYHERDCPERKIKLKKKLN